MLIGRHKLVTNNMCAQLIANESFFAKAYPMEKKSLAGAALCQFIQDLGVLEQLTFDGSGEQTGPKTEFMKHVRNHAINYHIIEPNRPQQNQAETILREVKKWWFTDRWSCAKFLNDFGTTVVCGHVRSCL
jgi:hypothetical protein